MLADPVARNLAPVSERSRTEHSMEQLRPLNVTMPVFSTRLRGDCLASSSNLSAAEPWLNRTTFDVTFLGDDIIRQHSSGLSDGRDAVDRFLRLADLEGPSAL